MLEKLHAKVGDFWWYSAMIFLACRLGDGIQAFIGLWLVPKYVGTQELGAVMPLQSLATLFAAPLAILATVFSKYVNTYATRGEMGKVKSFIRDIITTACLIFILCIAAAQIILPHFYERLRIANGLLTILILLAGFTTNLSQLFTNALQGLKKFKTMSIITLIGAPIRLITLLIAMPIRALSGYILGQTTPPAASSFIAFLTLRKDFKSVSPDPTWRRDLPSMLRYAIPLTVSTISGAICAALFNTLIRQRLPEVESAAYYMLTRLAEIGSYLSLSLLTVLFPLAAESHEQGHENRRVLHHAVLGSIAFSIILALVFGLCGRPLFGLVSIWQPYQNYAYLLIPTTINSGLVGAIGTITIYEIACRRFAATWFALIENIAFVVVLACFMGCEFFRGTFPDSVVDWMASLHFNNLTTIIYFSFANAIFQLIVLALISRRGEKKVIRT